MSVPSFPYLILVLFVAWIFIVIAMAKIKKQHTTDTDGQTVSNDIIHKIKNKYDYTDNMIDDLIFIPIKPGQCVIWDNNMYKHFVYANKTRLMIGPMDVNFDEVGMFKGWLARSFTSHGPSQRWWNPIRHKKVPIRYATACHTVRHADTYPQNSNPNDISIVVYLNDADGYFILQRENDSDKDNFKTIDLSTKYKNYITELYNDLNKDLNDDDGLNMLLTCTEIEHEQVYANIGGGQWAPPSYWPMPSDSDSDWAGRPGGNWVTYKTLQSGFTLLLQDHMYDLFNGHGRDVISHGHGRADDHLLFFPEGHTPSQPLPRWRTHTPLRKIMA